jgi:catechol 2,3-dioxygenase-like lactoylglutathione lyase family enzyme
MKFLHFGVKVDNIQEAMQSYTSLLGVTWNPVLEFDSPHQTMHGKPSSCKIFVTHGKTADGVEIEMIQLLDGAVPDQLVLGEQQGISHVAFTVDDLAAAKEKALAQGLTVVNEGQASKADWIFLLDKKLGGSLVQLVQMH